MGFVYKSNQIIGCNQCQSNDYTLINKRKIKYGIVELRQCYGCYKRYKIASNGITYFYY